MRFSRYFIPTLKESPSDAEVISHKLMLRAGMIRKVAAGIYNLLPTGFRSMKKVENIVREEMDKSGAMEILMPAIQPAELWQESGRWEIYGKELLRMKDRHNREFCFGPTHEEVITDLVRNHMRSYRDLAKNIYQIQMKFRDEIRPRFGLMRVREFLMKDAYSFDEDEKGLDKHYKIMHQTYCNIFSRCGVSYKPVLADSGAIGGDFTHEFHVLADSGEVEILTCDNCGYTANDERAEMEVTDFEKENSKKAKENKIEKVYTPNLKTVEDISRFLKVTSTDIIKTLIVKANEKFYALLIRGDRDLNLVKVKNFLKVDIVEFAEPAEIQKNTGGPLGFSGPKDLKLEIFADFSVKGMKNFVIGANEKDQHYIGTNFDRDFTVTKYSDFLTVKGGDRCPKCSSRLVSKRGIEVGQIFKLGTKYSKSMKANFLDKDGREKPIVMGCYGIGVGRTLAASIEQNNDENGIIFPISIAPFEIILLNLNTDDKKCCEVSDKIYAELKEKNFDVLYDDRQERPGFKFKDADLIGIPIRINIGTKSLKENSIEIKIRRDSKSQKIKVSDYLKKLTQVREDLYKECSV